MSGRALPRAAWALWGLSVALAASTVLLVGQNISTVFPRSVFEPNVAGDASFAVAFLSFTTVGAMIVARQPGNRIGWIFLASDLLFVLGILGGEYALYGLYTEPDSLPGVGWAAWAAGLPLVAVALALPFLLLLFPDGRLPSRRWRPAAWIAALGVAGFAGMRFVPGPLEDFSDVTNPAGIRGLSLDYFGAGWLLLPLAIAAGAVSIVLRFRRSTGDERLQLKWFTYAGTLFAAVFVPFFMFSRGSPTTTEFVLLALGFASFPTAAGIAILKHRLYDIDVVINRTVVFGTLVAFITIVYVGVVVGVGSLLGRTEPDLTLQVAATAVVAIAFHPVRERARRLANRLVYGERAEPYEVLVRFASRAAGTYATEDVLPRTARVIAEGTGAARAEVWLSVGQELRLGAGWPEDTARRPTALPMGSAELPEVPQVDRVVPVEHRGELLGALAVAKPPGEPLTPAEDALLRDLAKQAGLVLRNARLTEELRGRLEQIAARAAELRASRQRIVAAHDVERRRLERNIHDGAQQHLVALAVKLRLARDLLPRDADRAAGLLQELRAEIDLALETLRDLAGGIYPAVLEERGIVAALETQARLAGVPVRVEADGLTRRPIETEAAVYFACLEALQNAVKHAGASEVRIQLAEVAGHLSFSVRDDGRGFDPEAVPLGAGLRNMADRVEALGGRLELRSAPGSGTAVEGEVPIRVPEAVP